MRTVIIKILLPVLILAACSRAFAASEPASIPAEAKARMTEEIIRGSDEVYNCSLGLTADKEVVDCLNRVLDVNIQNDKDSAEFLMGAYFAAFGRLTATSPTPGVKDKWLATCFGRFSEIQKHLGFTDKELAEITQNAAVLPEIEKMRLKAGK